MRSGTAAEAWHCESPGMVTGEGEDFMAVEVSKLKGSGREVETWHNDEIPREITGKSAV